jgi:hypothetical protein
MTDEASIDEQPTPPSAAQVKRWPFVEAPGDFADRLSMAIDMFGGDLLSAVRHVLIENPPQIDPEYVALARQMDGLTAERDARISQLEADNATLHARNQSREVRIAELEADLELARKDANKGSYSYSQELEKSLDAAMGDGK